MDFWKEVPPPNISLALIAKAHGAKFEGGSASRSVEIQQADPQSVQAMIGQLGGDGNVRTYVAPAKGLTIERTSE